MKINISVKESKKGWSGSLNLTGVSGAKLTTKEGETLFPNKAALVVTARNLAKRLGGELELTDASTVKKTPVVKAPTAKKTPAPKAKTSTTPAKKSGRPKKTAVEASPTPSDNSSCQSEAVVVA